MIKTDKSTREEKLINALEKAQQSFAENTCRLARQDSDDFVTHGELYKALYSINSALSDIGTAFDNYFHEK